MRRDRLAVALALATALLLGCDGERKEAERVVRAYDDAAILAYRTHDLLPLQEVATKKEWGRVLVLADLKASNRLVLESELQRLEVASATRTSPDLFLVETRERWRYYDRPLDPGRPKGTTFVAEMMMRYELERSDGRWRVSNVRTISNEFLEPKGHSLQSGHSGQLDPEHARSGAPPPAHAHGAGGAAH